MILVFVLALVISFLLLLQGLVLPLVPGGPGAPGLSCSPRYPDVDTRKPRKRRLPGSPLLLIPDDVRSVMCKRVASQG